MTSGSRLHHVHVRFGVYQGRLGVNTLSSASALHKLQVRKNDGGGAVEVQTADAWAGVLHMLIRGWRAGAGVCPEPSRPR